MPLKPLAMFLVLAWAFCIPAVSQPIDTPCHFPIKPGDSAWAATCSFQGRWVLLEIPDSLLKRMTTRALLLTCLEYPALMEMIAYNTDERGLRAVEDHFNGLYELLRREDVALTVLHYYLKYNAGCPANRTTTERLNHKMSTQLLETIIGLPEILEKFSAKELSQLVKACVQKSAQIEKSKLSPIPAREVLLAMKILTKDSVYINSVYQEGSPEYWQDLLQQLRRYVRRSTKSEGKT